MNTIKISRKKKRINSFKLDKPEHANLGLMKLFECTPKISRLNGHNY